MSFAGIRQFDKNLRRMMASKAFINANEGQRLRMGMALIASNKGSSEELMFKKQAKGDSNERNNAIK